MNSRNEKSKNLSESLREVGPYLGLGSQLAVTIIILFFIGRWLDSEFQTNPILTIIFAFVGGFAGLYNFIHTVINLNKTKKREKSN